MITIYRLLGVICCCWTVGAWSVIPEEAPGCHPTLEEKKADQVAARDGKRSNTERRYERNRARGTDDDGYLVARDRESNMERRYERHRAEELREDEPIDETLHNTPADPYFQGRTYLGSSPSERE